MEYKTDNAFTLFFFFTFAFGLDFLKVVTSVASITALKSVPILKISKILVPAAFVLIENLSDVKSSVTPSALTKEYLSSSNGKNVSLLPAVITSVRESVEWLIATSKDLLIVIVAWVKSTSAINFLGVDVYNVLSVEPEYSDFKILRSETVKLPADKSPVVTTPTEFIRGKSPIATPVTVVIPVTLTLASPTAVTLTYEVVSAAPTPPKASKSFTFTFDGNLPFGLVIVLNPVVPLTTDIVASPRNSPCFWITSAENVFANPTSPKSGPA